MLVGREAEQERLGGLIEAARTGRGGALLMHGDQGIGKSALLSWAERQAAGLPVIRVRGSQTEGQIAYAGLFDVLRPFLRRLEELPSAQARALSGALGLEAPRGGDRLSIYGAALALLVAAADDGALLVTIDDVEWLDAASQEALGFVMRRLDQGAIACLVAARSDEAGPLAGASLPRLALAGLKEEAAARLLRSAAGSPIPEHVAVALVAASAGNPLALQSFPDLLTERQVAGRDPLPDPLPVAQGIELAFSRRLDGLPADTRQAVLLVAAADPEDSPAVHAVADQLGIRREWVTEGAAAGLISMRGGWVGLSHPLVRPVVLGQAKPGEIQQAHASLARHVSHAERRLWHQAAASERPDEVVAAGLESLALLAAARGAPSVAAHGYERAGRLSPEPEIRAARLFRGAVMAHAANMMEKAVALAEEVIEEPTAGETATHARQLRALVLMFEGRAMEVAREAAAAAEHLAPHDPVRAAAIYAFGAMVQIIQGAVPRGLELAATARRLAPRDGSRVDFVAGVAHAFLLTLSGRAEEADAEILAWPSAPGPTEDPAGALDLLGAVECLTFLGRTQPARALADLFVERARATGDLGVLQYALGARALGELRSGDWLASYADASEALRLASVATTMSRAVVQYRLGHVEAGIGHIKAAEEHLSGALEASRTQSIVSVEIPARSGYGLLELARDRPREALEHLIRADETSQGAGTAPGVFRYSGDLVDAAVHAGRGQVATEHLAYMRAFAAGQAWMRGSIERAAGSLSEDAEAEVHLDQAVSEYRAAEAPFDEARALLDLGVRLRRRRRIHDAQASIARAMAIFERLRAVPWLEKAGRELAKAGGARRGGGRLPDQLSPAELQVAIVVARGATNREAAAELFLSPKTIDHHLSSVYSKLGLRSRTELAHLMAAASPPERGTSADAPMASA